VRLGIAAVALFVMLPAAAADARPGLAPCRLRGVEHDVLCGQVDRPLDPAAPGGARIAVHYAVLPAVARNRRPDPVFFFAGGPGQSAIELASQVSRLLARLQNRRDLVLIDQRGTGRSAPLVCETPSPRRPLHETADPEGQFAQLAACRQRLQALPHGDLRHYTTTIAMQDAEAVRQALDAPRINLVGGSYGTRAALEYLRQFPQAVRRVVLDGVAPPDMALPQTFGADGQRAFDALLAACAAEAACQRAHPALAEHWRALLASLPRSAVVTHPYTGAEERLTVTREIVLGLVRLPLYAPLLASALPFAIDEAAAGRFGPLLALGTGFGGGRASAIAEGMHFSVVCSEDLRPGAADADEGVFAASARRQYERVCADWPRASVPAAFYRMPPAPAPVLLLSGGLDPVTPPRHAERAAKALGPRARSIVVANAGHGLMSIGCLRDVIFRFVDAEDEAAALAVDGGCAATVPRPPAFRPLAAASTP
jgi:pimeloyl-ACP methyl ester carboxylesterase